MYAYGLGYVQAEQYDSKYSLVTGVVTVMLSHYFDLDRSW